MPLFVVTAIMTLTLTIEAMETPVKSVSPYGKYNLKYRGFIETPKNFKLEVGSEQQSVKLNHKIEYALTKYPAVEESLKSISIKCNLAYVNDIGLEETCPTELQRATQVYINGEECAVVRPGYQCVTFAVCQQLKLPCSGSGSSECLYDGFRYFRAWVYCKSCGFKLVKLKLPQCCSCRKFQVCEIPQN